jgi:hypothetical protein
MNDPVFDDVEVQRILERAADQQQKAERTRLVGPGRTSLATIREIATEVGIDPRYVESAAQEVTLRRDHKPEETRLGIPRSASAHRVLAHRVDEAEWGRIVDHLQRTFDTPGVVSEFGKVREWHSGTRPGGTVVHFKLDEGEVGTTASISQNLKQFLDLPTALGTVFATLGVGLLALLPIVDSQATLGLLSGLNVLAAGGIYFGGMSWVGRIAQRRQERIEAALDRVELLAASTERRG